MANNSEFLYSTGPQSAGPLQYGGVGSAQFFGLQNELLRRAALAEAQRQQAMAEQRQREQDALERQVKEQQIAASKENVLSNKELREATAEQRRAAANASVLKLYKAGQTVTPEQAAKIKGAGGDVTESTTATNIPAQFAEAPAETENPELTNVGTPEQQQDLAREKRAKFIVDSLMAKQQGGKELSPLEQEMLYSENSVLSTGRSAQAPAGVIVPKTGSTHHDTPEERFYAAKNRIAEGTATPEDQRYVKDYANQHAGESTKQANRIEIVNTREENTKSRQTSRELFQTKQKLRTDIAAEDAKLATDLERVKRAESVLNSPNFLTDAIAAPEVLQIMAGGMGSGLRMTDAELNRVNDAQTKLDKLRGQLAKYGLGTPVTIQNEMRQHMKDIIATVAKARERKAQAMEDTLLKVDDAESTGDVDQLRAAYMRTRRESDSGKSSNAAAPALPPGVKVTREK